MLTISCTHFRPETLPFRGSRLGLWLKDRKIRFVSFDINPPFLHRHHGCSFIYSNNMLPCVGSNGSNSKCLSVSRHKLDGDLWGEQHGTSTMGFEIAAAHNQRLRIGRRCVPSKRQEINNFFVSSWIRFVTRCHRFDCSFSGHYSRWR